MFFSTEDRKAREDKSRMVREPRGMNFKRAKCKATARILSILTVMGKWNEERKQLFGLFPPGFEITAHAIMIGFTITTAKVVKNQSLS